MTQILARLMLALALATSMRPADSAFAQEVRPSSTAPAEPLHGPGGAGQIGSGPTFATWTNTGSFVPVAIPDGGTAETPAPAITCTFTQPQCTFRLIGAEVWLHITHPSTADLDIWLVAPDGTPHQLSSDNGGSGANYGASCSAATQETHFTDSATTLIINGSAPFVGDFLPEQGFGALDGKEVIGVWKVRVQDDQLGNTGILQCWNAKLYFESPNSNGSSGIGVVRNGSWFLRNTNTTGAPDFSFTFGLPSDVPVRGRWLDTLPANETPGLFRNGEWFFRNSNASAGTQTFSGAFGQSGDLPISGDWDNDGITGVGIFRNGQWFLRHRPDGNGPADMSLTFGQAGDLPVVGDWDGDNVDTVGVYRNGVFYLRNHNNSGFADLTVPFGGSPGDIPVVGDWNNDGVDTVGVYRGGQFLLRNSNSAGFADLTVTFGIPGDKPLAGDWDGLP